MGVTKLTLWTPVALQLEDHPGETLDAHRVAVAILADELILTEDALAREPEKKIVPDPR